MTTRPVAAYLRLSVALDDSTSIEGQERLAREAVAHRPKLAGLPIEIFNDEGVSGSKAIKRPARDELERRLARGEFSALVVKSVDRLARSTADFTRIAQICRDTQTDLIVSDLGVDTTTPTGNMMLGVLALLAEFEARMIGARVAAGNEDKIANGRTIGGPVPFGFRNVKHPDRPGTYRAVDPDEAKVVRRIARALLEGHSLRAIALALNEDGIPTPRQSATKAVWDFRSIERVASNPAIAGQTTFRGDVVRDDYGLPVINPDLAILTGAEFRAVQQAIEDRKQPGARRLPTSDRLLLDGIATCAGCGNLMRRKSTKGGRYASYACPRACSDAATISAASLDEYVVTEAMRLFGRYPVVEEVDAADPEVIEALTTVREEAADTFALMQLASPDEAQALFTRWQNLRAREDVLDARLHDSPLTQQIQRHETFRDAWAVGTHEERRQWLARFLGAVYVESARGARRAPVSGRVHFVDRTPEG